MELKVYLWNEMEFKRKLPTHFKYLIYLSTGGMLRAQVKV
jgi:hypothetical protein